MGSGCSSTRVIPGDAPQTDPGSPWVQWEDTEGGIFYYNFRTGVYSSEEQACDWYQFTDDNGNDYWYNYATHETSWNGPCQPPELHVLHDAMLHLVQQVARDNAVALPTATSDHPVAMAVPIDSGEPHTASI